MEIEMSGTKGFGFSVGDVPMPIASIISAYNT
jgi:hypothetical protein